MSAPGVGAEVVARCEAAGRCYGSGAGAVVALQRASCAVRAGERIVVTGPSGSGKSTLLHLLAGLETPSEGVVDWPAIGPRDRLRPLAVATILQGPSLLPPLDVLENVALPLMLGGMAEARALAAAAAALEALGLGSLSGRLPEEISGGQAQRVAVARVLAGSPRLVLADEPTGQLDGATGTQMLDVLDEAVARLGAALVLTTHDRRVAARFDTAWTMADGRLTGAA
ncbi:MAG TPA: ABC transporter ATP-binding protein [Candidatus Dormibacteraeota bacterium]